MKKLIIVLILLFAATMAFAQINLGTFPVGKWTDANYDATWEFTSNNIKVTDNKTGESFNFSGKVQDFKVVVDGRQPGITFSSDAAGRSYSFKAALPATDVVMEIERPGLPKYTVTMKKQ